MYLDAFDHFIKDELGLNFYLRYSDDAIILSPDRKFLSFLIPIIEQWLWHELRLELHPRKVEIRKLRQGIDFLGYIMLPHHRVLRIKTKKRLLSRINKKNVSSYLGVLKHADSHELTKMIFSLQLEPSALEARVVHAFKADF